MINYRDARWRCHGRRESYQTSNDLIKRLKIVVTSCRISIPTRQTRQSTITEPTSLQRSKLLIITSKVKLSKCQEDVSFDGIEKSWNVAHSIYTNQEVPLVSTHGNVLCTPTHSLNLLPSVCASTPSTAFSSVAFGNIVDSLTRVR
jgi:hypothetical protein